MLLVSLTLLLARLAFGQQQISGSINVNSILRQDSITPYEDADLPNSLRRFIRWAPKAELHVHVEGTLEPEMMMRFAERNGIPPPYPSVQAARAAYNNFSDLEQFRRLFYSGCSVLRTRADFYDLAIAYFRRAAISRVIHAEVFFDPQAHLSNGVEFDTFMGGLVDAAMDAEDQLAMTVSYIMCFRRDMSLESAERALMLALPWRHRIVAVGLDASNLARPPREFAPLFDRAAALGFKRTAHVGEEGSPEYIWQALQLLHVDRLDHGIHCLDDPRLVAALNTSRVPLTICPVSDMKLKVYDGKLEERLRQLIRSGLLVTVNSDDAAYFGAYLAGNYEWLSMAVGLNVRQAAQLVANGFQAAFSLPDAQRRRMVDTVWRMAEAEEAGEKAEGEEAEAEGSSRRRLLTVRR
ncbi:hypothetical protein Vretimale_7546 [Volvox reticuliferus]|uniref:Uncharacterized protein n=1 Tax=Volvox reticuliferus TaxID=1737510 RepID=A0A8J4CC77_9CHLO|nr:hypothetical protein Vretifemale_7620 [Volvox reticuliferus]GIM02714.1 hypothetical protein Vretimale_7546 [Volvox reticuliferus]